MIYLSDGTMVEVTSEQLLSSGLPRYPVPTDGESFQTAIRKALDQVFKKLTSASVFLSTAVAGR